MANAPYVQGTVTVGTSATLLCSPVSGAHGVIVQNNGTAAIFLGGPNVTASGATQGVQLAVAASITVPTVGETAHDLYAIVASTPGPVSFLFPA